MKYLVLLTRENKTAAAFDVAQKMKARSLLDVLLQGKVEVSGDLSNDDLHRERALRMKSDSLNQQLVQAAISSGRDAMRRTTEIRHEIEQNEKNLDQFEDELYARYPPLASRRAAKAATIEEITHELPEDTALLEYVMLRAGRADSVLLFVITQSGGKAVVTAHYLHDKGAAIESLGFDLHNRCRDPHKAFKPQAASLYRSLIAPVDKRITGKKRLIICPDGGLWSVPFAVLAQSASGRNLLEQYEIEYAYSATGVQAGFALARTDTARQPAHWLLAVGDPAFDQAHRFGDVPSIPGQRPIPKPVRSSPAASHPPSKKSPQSADPAKPTTHRLQNQSAFRGAKLARLPGTRKEIESIRKSFKDTTALLGDEAQETTVKKVAGDYLYLHFATHGFFNDSAPLLSAIVLSNPPAGDRNDGFLTAREFYAMKLNADMAVISACNSAEGEVRSGDGLIGLTWALTASGVRTQVVSQWSVDDESTAQLMGNFYARLAKPGAVKGGSLRGAELELKHIPKYSHPYYWAPFILCGNWR